MSVFARFERGLQEAIATRLRWASLRPVQELAGEALLDGEDAIVLAPTAGGKTEAALFPAISELLREPGEGVGILYVAPLKALLNNQEERLGAYMEMVGMRAFVWHGDASVAAKKAFLGEPGELLMTTPESLEVMLLSQRVDVGALFGDLRWVVVDEVHALAGTDRGAHLSSVLERVTRHSRRAVQRVGLSATVGNPEELLGWLQGTSRRRGRVIDPAKGPRRRELRVMLRADEAGLTRSIAAMAGGLKSLVFCQSRARAEAIAEALRMKTETFVHHSSVSREERQRAEERFAAGEAACIVSTSTLELGIDIGDLDRVFQVDAPTTVGAFLQRMGRTGRRVEQGGPPSNMTFVSTSAWSMLQAVALVELSRRGWVEPVTPTRRCWPVFVHQLVALSLAEAGVSFEGAWRRLSVVPDFAGIAREEAEEVVAHMLEDEALVEVDGRLVVGPKVERTFGRQHFRELYAVFFSPQAYAVVAKGAVIGTLEQAFVDMLSSGARVAFLLSGRPWVVRSISHEARQVEVEAAGAGEEPVWGGVMPVLLGGAVCGEMRRLLAGSESPAYLDDEARAGLERLRVEMGGVVEDRDGARSGYGDCSGGLEVDDKGASWWTFAGGKVNWTLRFAIGALRPDWSVSADNFRVRVRGEGLGRAALAEVVARLREVEVWQDRALWGAIGESLPNFRMSKFDVLFPEWVRREVVAAHLIDVPAAYEWLSGRAWRWVARIGAARPGIAAEPGAPA